jgi:DNA-binding CsgD family transcriptional regulator
VPQQVTARSGVDGGGPPGDDESTMADSVLLARQAEVDTLDQLLATARDRGCSLVIRGAPGVGKTAMLDEMVRRTSDLGWRVLRTEGTPSERRLPLAALHRLLRPVMGSVDRLPAPQRDALRGAFGLVDAPPPEIFLVALAALGLLAEVASHAPVAVLVDDVHWLDRSSAEVLTFVARRIESDPILLLAATRVVEEDLLTESSLPELMLQPLDEVTAGALLDHAAPDLSAPHRQSILTAAAGNPLALLELPKALEQFGHGSMLPGLLPVTHRLKSAFVARAAALPPVTEDLLLLAALNDSDSVTEVLAGARALRSGDASLEGLDPAVSAGLVEVTQSSVRFRHPLIRSAIYQSSTLDRRQRAHAALTSVLPADSDRRVWHRAAATLGTDEDVATDLEEVASRAERRGTIPGAISALERSAELTSSTSRRGRRLVRAADLAHQVGQSNEVDRLLHEAEPLLSHSSDRLRWEWVRELSDEAMQGGAQRVDALVAMAAEAGQQSDTDLAAEILLRAGTRCWHLDLEEEVGERVVAASERLGLEATDPRQLVINAYASPLRRGAAVIELLPGPAAVHDHQPDRLLLLGHAAACVGAFGDAEAICSAAADGLRRQGRLASLARALMLQAWAAARRSRWQVAIPAAEECVRLAVETHQPIVVATGLAAQAMVAAVRGDLASAGDLAKRAEQSALANRNNIGLALTQVARALGAAGEGRSGQAFDLLWRVYQTNDPAHQRMQGCWSIGILAEAAAHSGHRDQARAVLSHLEPLASGTPSPGVQIPLSYARAVLADPHDAEEHFAVALGDDLSDWPFEHGRLLLAYGGWLRRQQRVTQSRSLLRAAREDFDRIGARSWAERARGELRAAGESSARPTTRAWDTLSPQEMQIAQLVAEGLGNKEIGERLYLSHRTVGSHLYRIFPKLGISSRGQLTSALAASSLPGSTGPDLGH